MNLSEMVAAALDQRIGSNRTTTATRKVNSAISQVWAAGDWAFKEHPPANLAIVAGTEYYSFNLSLSPTGAVEELLELRDENGLELMWLPRDQFESVYDGSDTGTPSAWTSYGSDATLQIRVGPVPTRAATYTQSFKVGPPTLVNDGDDLATYGWPAAHHEIVPVIARMDLIADENDGTWRELEGTKKRLLDAMIDALSAETGGGTRQYGGDDL